MPLPLRIAFLSCLPGFLGCAETPRRLEYATIESRAMHAVEMNYAIYTPPGFQRGERLPLVVFLHGGGDSHESFDQWNIGARLDEAIAGGRIPRCVVALPEGHLGFWANWMDGSRNYEDWVLYEMMPEIARRYGTQPCPEGCHIMGVSMGGAGTLRMALRHPDVFSSAGIISAPVMDTDAMLGFVNDRLFAIFIPTHRIWGEPPRSVVENEDPFIRWDSEEHAPRIFLAWAEDDRGMIVQGSRRLHEHLEEVDVDHAHEEFEGGHNWYSWGPVIERALSHALSNR